MRWKERQRERKKEIGRHETVKTQKWYYLCNMSSEYFPISRRYIVRQRERARETECK